VRDGKFVSIDSAAVRKAFCVFETHEKRATNKKRVPEKKLKQKQFNNSHLILIRLSIYIYSRKTAYKQQSFHLYSIFAFSFSWNILNILDFNIYLYALVRQHLAKKEARCVRTQYEKQQKTDHGPT
jgi:hypothetical protein